MGLIRKLKPVAACTCDATSAVSDQISPGGGGGGHFHIDGDGDVPLGGRGGGWKHDPVSNRLAHTHKKTCHNIP